jgi:hypothetical protein
MMDNIVKKFCCVKCKFYTDFNGNLKQHFLTKKHLKSSLVNETINPGLKCLKCGKIYESNSGIWKHTKKCQFGEVLSPKEVSSNLSNEFKELKNIIIELVNSRQEVTTNVNNNTINNNFKINVFLNETCKNAINLDCFIKNLMFELADPKLMIGNYVDGTCNILQRNLDELPLNKRPLHCMEGEDPNQQLMHIRQDNKWNIGTYVNWLEQIHADDDDDVVEKNPIYYALKTIDDEKLKYLGYNFYQDVDYKLQHGRLNREVVRQDLKKDVYKRLLKIITLDTNKLTQ